MIRSWSAAWIVIPAYQAGATLGTVIERIPAELRRHGTGVLVVDDGSTDGTAEIARRGGATVLRSERNAGYAQAQKRGFRHALEHGAEAVVVLHADGQYPPEALPAVLAPIMDDRADVVIGSRVIDGGARRRGMPAYKWFANRALSFVQNRCYGLALSEYHSGMMAYSAHALRELPWPFVSDTFHFDGELAMLAGRRGLRIEEVPIAHVYGEERSYLHPIPYGLTVLAISLSVPLGIYDRWLRRRCARAAALSTAPAGSPASARSPRTEPTLAGETSVTPS